MNRSDEVILTVFHEHWPGHETHNPFILARTGMDHRVQCGTVTYHVSDKSVAYYLHHKSKNPLSPDNGAQFSEPEKPTYDQALALFKAVWASHAGHSPVWTLDYRGECTLYCCGRSFTFTNEAIFRHAARVKMLVTAAPTPPAPIVYCENAPPREVVERAGLIYSERMHGEWLRHEKRALGFRRPDRDRIETLPVIAPDDATCVLCGGWRREAEVKS